MELISLLVLILTIKSHGLLTGRKLVIPKEKVVDLRSDTITKPTPQMRKAMFEAEVGDDVFGEDPTMNQLEERMAKLFGKEKALFFPTGTMANLAAVMTWCDARGSEMILGDLSHIHIYEQGGVSQLGGVATHNLPNLRDGTMDLHAVEHAIRADNIHYPVTQLITIENTHNYCGGKVLPMSYLQDLGQLARTKNIPVHCDGARIWNAATALQVPLHALAADVDSISACLSKGLGAPAGTLLMSDQPTFIQKARRLRKALGGGMRQVGILAAAGLQALDDYEQGNNMILNDHRRAQELARRLCHVPGILIEPEEVETNILVVHLDLHEDHQHHVEEAAAAVIAGSHSVGSHSSHIRGSNNNNHHNNNAGRFLELLKEKGILALPRGNQAIRLVMHRDLTDEDIVYAANTIREVVARLWVECHDGQQQSVSMKKLPSSSKQQQQQQHHDLVLAAAGAMAAGASEELTEDFLLTTEDNNAAATADIISPSVTTAAAPAPSIPSPPHPPTTSSVVPSIPYEQSSIYAMSVSEDGFCVFLQGSISDRIVKLLVTPADPMVYGLDREQVESSEAVTLVQLLQGIDVETYLPKDTLSTRFNDNKNKYKLRRVMISSLGCKDHHPHGSLSSRGSSSSSGSSSSNSQSDSSSIGNNDLGLTSSNNTSSSSNSNKANSLLFAAKLCGFPRKPNIDDPLLLAIEESGLRMMEVANHGKVTLLSSIDTVGEQQLQQQQGNIGGGYYNSENPDDTSTSAVAAAAATTLAASSSSPLIAPTLPYKEVDSKNAFETIALALRHNAAIEVKSDLFFDEKVSYATPEEVLSEYPQAILASIASHPIDKDQDRIQHEPQYAHKIMERLQRQLYEANRQRKDGKMEIILHQIEFLLQLLKEEEEELLQNNNNNNNNNSGNDHHNNDNNNNNNGGVQKNSLESQEEDLTAAFFQALQLPSSSSSSSSKTNNKQVSSSSSSSTNSTK